jgi:RNA polymerase sigma-70 factor (ECF subfamily)
MHRTDRQLLRAAAEGSSDAFGAFYSNHVKSLLAFFVWRTGDAEVAADLASETFAAAFVGVRGYRGEAEPGSWLYGIARRKLASSRRRGRVESSARARIAMRGIHLEQSDVDEIASLAKVLPPATPALDLLERLPEPQREAIRARMLDELEYPEIARGLRCSEAVVRQRISRGLRTLRAQLDAPGAGT